MWRLLLLVELIEKEKLYQGNREIYSWDTFISFTLAEDCLSTFDPETIVKGNAMANTIRYNIFRPLPDIFNHSCTTILVGSCSDRETRDLTEEKMLN